MFEQEYDISRLIVGYLRQELSVDDRALLESWLAASAANRQLFQEMTSKQIFSNDMLLFRSADRSAIWQKTLLRLQEVDPSVSLVVKKRSLFSKYKYLAIAASLLLMFSIGIYLHDYTYVNDPLAEVNTNVVPGKNTATLTLANGRKIVLSDAVNGEIAKEAGVKISKAADGKLVYELLDVNKTGEPGYNTLSTARGEQYQVILQDGSKVWLNAASSIVYPETFAAQKERKIKLIGEAYFEVVKNKSQPFCVEAAQQRIVVLGTHFNVNSYEDESDSRTTLLEGSVKINSTTFLKPNEQAIVKDGTIEVVPVMADTFIDWKDGVFAFKNEDLRSVMRKIARWYDVQVVYELKKPYTNTFTGTISRSDNIAKVLRALREISGLKFKIEGKRITVSN